MRINLIILLTLILSSHILNGQTTLTVYPDSALNPLNSRYEYGVFYVPKTIDAQNDFLNNGEHLNTIRLHIIESVLNNSADLNSALNLLDTVGPILQSISAKADKIILIFEKMPAWLSSSSDGSPSQTPGWYVLNTKPPANYNDWNAMVIAITNRIWNTYGIHNSYFEIWNEPDLGSWTGSQAEYFELFRNTRNAVKSVDSLIPVGGPATNHWANNISFIAPFGYVNNTEGNLSLIAELIDSSFVWNFPLDFISWHNFNVSVETYHNAIQFINTKYTASGYPVPELIISEWNAPSSIRDTTLHFAFAVKNTITIKNSGVAADAIAAWQDFESSPQEFHSDYGLLTYGSIRKPFLYAVLLAEKVKGTKIKHEINIQNSVETSIHNDTLIILITNYAPPPIIEALNQTLFDGEFNIWDLDSAGYIDISGGDYSYLEEIYSGQTSIPNTSALNQAILQSIDTYAFYDSIQFSNHDFEIVLAGYNNAYKGKMFLIDSTTNNNQYLYDSLLHEGYTQYSAISYIRTNQEITGDSVLFTSGKLNINLKPNSVVLIKAVIPELTNIGSKELHDNDIIVFPNPAGKQISITSNNKAIGEANIIDMNGKIIQTFYFEAKTAVIDVSMLERGTYLICFSNHKPVKIVLN